MNKSMRILAVAVILMGVGTVLADYEVEYNVELKGNSGIKFEDAKCFEEGSQHGLAACLGEDGAVETDTFVCTVEGECDCVTISVKAGRGKNSEESQTIFLGANDAVILKGFTGFTVEIEVEDGTYTLKITSDDEEETSALSHAFISFGNTQNALAAPTVSVPAVTTPEDGPCCISRVSDSEAPTEL